MDWLHSDAGHEDVRESQLLAQRLGVSGVPFTIIDGRFGLSGAQPAEAFARAFDRAAATVAT